MTLSIMMDDRGLFVYSLNSGGGGDWQSFVAVARMSLKISQLRNAGWSATQFPVFHTGLIPHGVVAAHPPP